MHGAPTITPEGYIPFRLNSKHFDNRATYPMNPLPIYSCHHKFHKDQQQALEHCTVFEGRFFLLRTCSSTE